MSLFAYPFVQRALMSVLLASVLLGGLSHLVVARRLAFFSAAIGQAVLTGVALGAWLGEPLEAPWGSVAGFSLLVGIGLVALRRRSSLSTDTLVGVMLAFTLGLGVCLLVAVTKRFNVHQLEAVMFGSVLTVTATDLVMMAILLVAVFAAIASRANRLVLSSIDGRLAAAANRADAHLEARDEYLFVVLLTLAIVVSVKVMGALMVEALLVVPAAAGRNVARTVVQLFMVSILVALVASVGGVVLSTWANVPSGAAIVLGLAFAFLSTLPFRSRR